LKKETNLRRRRKAIWCVQSRRVKASTLIVRLRLGPGGGKEVHGHERIVADTGRKLDS
jgi:hypothetical protein